MRAAQVAGERFPLAAVLHARRRAADQLDLRAIARGLSQNRDGHRGAELRSLPYHRAVAQRLSQEMVEEARQRLATWIDELRARYAEPVTAPP